MLALNTGFLFQISSHSFGEKLELRDKIWNGKPGFEASNTEFYVQGWFVDNTRTNEILPAENITVSCTS